jgi:hypothetical protein
MEILNWQATLKGAISTVHGRDSQTTKIPAFCSLSIYTMLNFTVWMEKNSLAGWVLDALKKKHST